MKRKIAYIVVVAYIATIVLLLYRQTVSAEILNGSMYVLIVIALISFLFSLAERIQLYNFWPKGEILMCTPTWFKRFYWMSTLFVLYLAFAGGFEFTKLFVLVSLALGVAYLSPYLFVSKIAID